MPGSRRGVVGALAAVATAAMLAGCVPQSAESFGRYVDALDAIPGVEIVSRGFSTPLPFSVHGSVEVALDADAESYAALVVAACETEVNAAVHLEVVIQAGETQVASDFRDRCTPPPIDLVGLARATEEFGVSMHVSLWEDAGRVGLSGAGPVRSTLPVLAAMADLLPAARWELAAGAVVLNADAAAVADHVADFEALADAFPVESIDLSRGTLVVRTDGATDGDALRELLLARGGDRYRDVAIVVSDASAGPIPSGTRPDVIELRDRVQAEVGGEARIIANGLYLVAYSGAEVVALSERILALDPAGVPIGIRIPSEVPSAASSSGSARPPT